MAVSLASVHSHLYALALLAIEPRGKIAVDRGVDMSDEKVIHVPADGLLMAAKFVFRYQISYGLTTKPSSARSLSTCSQNFSADCNMPYCARCSSAYRTGLPVSTQMCGR